MLVQVQPPTRGLARHLRWSEVAHPHRSTTDTLAGDLESPLDQLQSHSSNLNQHHTLQSHSIFKPLITSSSASSNSPTHSQEDSLLRSFQTRLHLNSNLMTHSSSSSRSISSISTPPISLPHPSQPAPQPGLSKRAANQRKTFTRAQRDAELAARLPAFQLQDPHYSHQVVHLCPSEHHPTNSLGSLLDQVLLDAIPLDPRTRALAFDMEWVISRRRGHECRTSIIQLAGKSMTVILQLGKFQGWSSGLIPTPLYEFLINPLIIKLGVGIRNDGLKLLRDFPHQKPYLNSYLELSHLVKAVDRERFATEGGSRLLSLQYIVGTYLDVYLAKGDVRTSDWSKQLSKQQLDCQSVQSQVLYLHHLQDCPDLHTPYSLNRRCFGCGGYCSSLSSSARLSHGKC